MAISKNTVSIILTYFDDPLIQYKLYNHSKAYQAFNHIDIYHYKLVNFLKITYSSKVICLYITPVLSQIFLLYLKSNKRIAVILPKALFN